MSITEIHIRGFQSLKQADLDLGTFTVIVGPSSSGKSALIRALRALASNVRGTDVITRGQKQLAITARTDTHVITLERSERESAYRMTAADGQTSVFTKLGGAVPEQITAALRLDPGTDSVNFAGQFDKPYLLDESGASIARQLAELTNVNTIFEAVRAANKIRTSALATLRTRQGDLDAVRAALRGYLTLAEQLRAFVDIQALNDARKALQGRLGRLEAAIRALQLTETTMQKYKPADLPDSGHLEEVVQRYLACQTRIQACALASTKQRDARYSLDGLTAHVQVIEKELSEKLADIKVCPTCGQYLRYLE